MDIKKPRITGTPKDMEVIGLLGICDQETGSVPVSVTLRLESPSVPAFWMEMHLSKEIIEAMYDWLHGGLADLPELK